MSPTLKESNSVLLKVSTRWSLPIIGTLPEPTWINKQLPLMLRRGPDTREPSSRLKFFLILYAVCSSTGSVRTKPLGLDEITVTLSSLPTWYFAYSSVLFTWVKSFGMQTPTCWRVFLNVTMRYCSLFSSTIAFWFPCASSLVGFYSANLSLRSAIIFAVSISRTMHEIIEPTLYCLPDDFCSFTTNPVNSLWPSIAAISP